MKKTLSTYNLPAIGIDVGGTKISAGWVEKNKLVKSYTLPTPGEGKNAILKAIENAIAALHLPEFSGIGVGIPGLVNTRNGMVYDVQNIPGLSGMALKKELEAMYDCPVEINNDANCFVLGVKNHETGRPFQNLVGLTLGTGLGGGLILNGKLYEGTGTGAGELGFLPYKEGILEHYCSGQFFHLQYGISGKEALRRALKGDPEALEMYNQFGKHLGEAIKIIAHLLAPEAVVLGGSISTNFWLFEKAMWESIRKFPYAHVVDHLRVMPAVSPDIAMVGAASLLSENKMNKEFNFTENE